MTSPPIGRRDYGLIGRDSEQAQRSGLAQAKWYASPIDRKTLKALMQRSDVPAIRDTLLWLAALLTSGALVYASWGTWAAVPFMLIYGVLYGSVSDSRWHECGHGTAFRTRWMNDVVYHVASFMVLREPTVWRWSHARHHTDTLIVGRDPEIVAQRPPRLLVIVLDFFALKSGAVAIGRIVLHASGRLTREEETFIPAAERWKVYAAARVYLTIFAAVAAACAYTASVLPALYVGLPTFYGAWLAAFFGLTQHAGLAEDVLDHRLNTRTVYMNPIFRFLYWNMNYHVEHHMFPLVPYHALPRLHAAIKLDCPAPAASCWAAYREIVPALVHQSRDPTWFVQRSISGVAGAASPAIARTIESAR